MDVKQFRHRFFREKWVAIGAAVLLLAGVYWGLSAHFVPVADPDAPISLFPGSMMLYIAVLLLLVLFVMSSLLTLFSRAVGGMAAALVAMAGLSMRSPSAESLFWSYNGPSWALYANLLSSLLILAVALAAGQWIFEWIHSRLRRRMGQWAWDGVQPAENPPVKSPETWKDAASMIGFSMCCGGLIAVFLMRTTLRGQVLFALFIGFLVSTMAGLHFLSQVGKWRIWVPPVLVGAFVYIMGAFGINGMPVFRTLPIDWITAGAAGAFAGEWFYLRIRDVHVMEHELTQEVRI